MDIQEVSLDRLMAYKRKLRKNDRAVTRMAAAIKEFGFKIPVLARHRGEQIEVVDGDLRIKGAKKLRMTVVPVIFCDEWSEAQVKAFRLLVNHSANWATWDEDLVALELKDLDALDFDLSLTGFDAADVDKLLFSDGNEESEVVPEMPEIATTLPGDLWLCNEHRVLCGDATSADAVARLLAEGKPQLMVTDPPYGISIDNGWRDLARVNGGGHTGPVKKRTHGHTETTILGDTRAEWSDAFALVPSLEVAYVWHASQFTREVLDGLLQIGFLHFQQIIWNKGRAVLTRTLYWYQHEPCWFVWKKNAPWYGRPGENSTVWDSPSPKFIRGGSDEDKFNHPNQKPCSLIQRPLQNHLRRGELVYDPFLGSGTTLACAELTRRVCYGMELDPKHVDVGIKRWQQLTGKQAVLDGDGRTFEQVAAERRQTQEVQPCPAQN
jgi:DNA modification methylase